MEHELKICSLVKFARNEARLEQELREWAEAEVELHDDPSLTGVPRGSAGSVLGLGNPIASKRVLEASAIVEELIDMKIPPAIIAKGGYATADECVEKIMSGMKKIITGEIKIKQPKTRAWQTVSA